MYNTFKYIFFMQIVCEYVYDIQDDIAGENVKENCC